jgi:hypothetical protein
MQLKLPVCVPRATALYFTVTTSACVEQYLIVNIVPFFSSEQATKRQGTCRGCTGKFKPAGHSRRVHVANAWLFFYIHVENEFPLYILLTSISF